MRDKIKKTTEVLNDLLKINYDRIAGYQQAAEETQELDLQSVFKAMVNESNKNVSALIRIIKKSGSDAIRNTTTIWGKIYRAIGAAFTNKDRASILESCEFEEVVTQAAYRDAISSNDLSSEIRQMVRNQQVALKAGYETIRYFRTGNQVTFG